MKDESNFWPNDQAKPESTPIDDAYIFAPNTARPTDEELRAEAALFVKQVNAEKKRAAQFEKLGALVAWALAFMILLLILGFIVQIVKWIFS